MTHG
jgi:hypothetical protein